MDFMKIAKNLERKHKTACEIRIKFMSKKPKTSVFGDLKKRAVEIIPIMVAPIDEEVKKDMEKLKGSYSNIEEFKKKVQLLGSKWRYYTVEGGERAREEGQLNYTYHILEDGIYIQTPGIHAGFMEGVGRKTAKIKYELL
jgi:hypothetical protein